MGALIMSTSSTSVQKWCEKASEAIKMTPYEPVYGIKSHRERENYEEQFRKRQKITENQEKYNNKMATVFSKSAIGRGIRRQLFDLRCLLSLR